MKRPEPPATPRRWRLFALLAIATLALAGCADSGTGSAGPTSGGPSGGTIRVAAFKATAVAPALKLAEFLPAGWKTEITYFTAPADMSNALLSGSADVAYIGLTVAAAANAQSQPIVVVGNLCEKGSRLLARKGSDITTVAGLKGKKIGTIGLSIHEVLLRETLRQAGMDPDKDVEILRIAPPELIPSLQRGTIDAMLANEPTSSIALTQGVATEFASPYDNAIGTINAGVLSSRDVVDKKPELLRVWAGAHRKAVESLANDPEALSSLVASNWGLNKDAVKASAANLNLTWKFGSDFTQRYQTLIDRLAELKVIAKSVDAKTIVVDQFVNAS